MPAATALRHPNVVAIHETFTHSNQTHHVMEYCDRGSLKVSHARSHTPLLGAASTP